MKVDFEHSQSAHCENGAVSSLLNFHNLPISEPMVFGIGSGLFFSYMPFIRLNGMPLISYRTFPGWIFKKLTKRLGITMKMESFSDQHKAMKSLDQVLARGLPVGCLTSVFYLPYLPKVLRFHFNAHNIVIFGKENDNYLVSDPVAPITTEISSEDLQRARFARGTLAPKGKMYYPVVVPKNPDLRKAIASGIKETATDMLMAPGPFFGVRGIGFMARSLKKWPARYSEKETILRLGHLIRMQEEIGTGGAGFRFIYAAFLQEAAAVTGIDQLARISEEVTETGDRWRDLAFEAGRICKGRAAENASFSSLSDILLECADREKIIFKKLRKVKI